MTPQVFDRVKIRNRYLQKDFALDFLGVMPFDFLVYYYTNQGGSVVAFLRITKMIHTHKLYRHMRQQYSERSSSTARLVADIQSLYCFSLAIIHVMACIWYHMTQELPIFTTLGKMNMIGDDRGTDVSALNISSYIFLLLAGFTLHCYFVSQDYGGPFAIRYYIYCGGVVLYVISAQGMPTNISGSPEEVWFLVSTIVLNLSFWAYLIGSISGKFMFAQT